MKIDFDSVREDSQRVGIILASAGLLSTALKEGNLWIGNCLVTAGLALMQSVSWRTKMTNLDLLLAAGALFVGMLLLHWLARRSERRNRQH